MISIYDGYVLSKPDEIFFIHVDFVKYANLTCERKRTKLQMYLIDELQMRYDLKLFQIILNLMEVMCLVQECMKNSVG